MASISGSWLAPRHPTAAAAALPAPPPAAARARVRPAPLRPLCARSSPACSAARPLPPRRRQTRQLAPPVRSSGAGDEAQPQPQALALSSSDDAAPPPLSVGSGDFDAGSGSGDEGVGSTGEGGGEGVQIDLELPRRSLLVQFTCNKCGGRSERLVNPVAWERGMVIAQCQHCSAWHKLADAANLVEEIRYADLEDE